MKSQVSRKPENFLFLEGQFEDFVAQLHFYPSKLEERYTKMIKDCRGKKLSRKIKIDWVNIIRRKTLQSRHDTGF